MTENPKIDEKKRKNAAEQLKGIEFLDSARSPQIVRDRAEDRRAEIPHLCRSGRRQETYQVDMFKTADPPRGHKDRRGSGAPRPRPPECFVIPHS